jgi:stearoyl-CoA desaturase (delta-9 desaturase)
LVAIAGVIHDVKAFVEEHPGGRTLIKSAVGKDATALFNGGVYEHSNAAHNMLATMRVGVLRGGQEVEVWKTQRRESMKSGIMQQITRVEVANGMLPSTQFLLEG